MTDLRKKLFVTATILLTVSLVLGGSLWKQLGAIETKLADTTARLNAAEARIEQIKGEGSWLVDYYPELRTQIGLRLGEGPDARHFITPDDPAVSTKVQEITGGYSEDSKEWWADYEHLYRWVITNVEYTIDGYIPVLPEPMNETLEWQLGFWRTPAETIRDEAGDCEDMSALLISMLLNYNGRQHPVWGIGIESSKPEPARHIAVAFPVIENRITILDPTARYHTVSPVGWGMAAYDAQVATDDWLARWAEKMSDARVYMVFSEDFYQEFNSTGEFIEWVNNLELWTSS